MSVRTTAVPPGYTARTELRPGRLGRAVLCLDDASGRDVVVRLLDRSPQDERGRVLLNTELAAAAAASRHGCAVAIESVWTDESTGVCLRQRYMPAGSAQALLDAGAPWAPDDVIVLGIRIVAALAHSHRMGVLHLDVRPANLLADGEGNWLLADGGLLRSAPGTSHIGDPRYAPRELRGWEQPGPACDVYGLGATLLALLGGTGPSDAVGGAGSLPEGLAPALGGLLSRMTAADPSARPALAEVDRVLRGSAHRSAMGRFPVPEVAVASAPVPLPVRRLGTLAPEVPHREDGRRTRLIAAAVGVAVVFGLAAGLTVATLDSGDEPDTVAAAAVSAAPVATPDPSAATQPLDAASAPAERKAVVARVAPSALGPAQFKSPNVGRYLAADVKFEILPAGYEVTWSEPVLKDNIAGYLITLTVDGRPSVIRARQYAPPGQLLAVFTSPPIGARSCVAVNPLIDDGKTIRVAIARPNCAIIASAFKRLPKGGAR